MPETRSFVITRAEPRRVTPRNGNPFDLLEVYDDQGRTWVARQDVYNLAKSMVGQRVTAYTRTETNDRGFTNNFLDSLQADGQPQTQPSAPQQVVVAPNEAEKQRSIHRQTAGKVAAQLSQTPAEFWENVQAVFRYFETGEVPQWNQPTGQDATVSRPNQGAYRQYTPDQPTDDDIPF